MPRHFQPISAGLAKRAVSWQFRTRLEALWKHDLPERLDPMTAKELRQSLRRGSFVLPFIGIQVLALIAMTAEFRGGHAAPASDFTGVLNPWLLVSSGPFWMIVGAVCMVLMPLGGVVLMGQELDEGNHELLLLSKLGRWSVVRGKFLTLWSLCLLTLVSLLPYVIVRYQIGGVELVRDLVCALTVAGLSAVLAAGAIGASAFRVAGRVGVMTLFLFSAAVGGGTPIAAAGSHGSPGVFWHLNAVAAVVAYVLLGLSLGRSRLRLVVHAYEVKPSFLLVGLLFFAPFVIGMTTAMSLGFGGFVGLIGMALVGVYGDVTPKAPGWVKPPAPNVPGAP